MKAVMQSQATDSSEPLPASALGQAQVDGCGVAGPSDDRLNDLSQIICAYNDVTEKLQSSHESLKAQVARLQLELASTNAKLQRSKRLAALGEMAAGIAHEIRNPLGAIQLYAGILVDDLSGQNASKMDLTAMLQAAKKIAVAVRGLDAIVHDVLSFSRELAPRPVSIRVVDLFDRAVEACGPMIEGARVVVNRLDRRVASQSLEVCVDPMLMHQSLINLIRNAVDAMSFQRRSGAAAGDRPRDAVLDLDARKQGRQVLLVVRDSGPGIAERDIDRIFNPFFTTRNTGTGLGLAIVHRIMDAHSGTIGVHNNSGAVFELSLPVLGVTDEPGGAESEDGPVCVGPGEVWAGGA